MRAGRLVMMRHRWLPFFCLVGLCLNGCEKRMPKKFDATRGRVTGIVYCADTGRPARFATVTLTTAPAGDGKSAGQAPLAAVESVQTDLNGRFTMEAVEPGHYYAFATQEGYLDPERGIDFDRLNRLANDQERAMDAIRQWKAHLTEVHATAQRTTDLTLEMQRAAEIDGTVSYDDGSPAIGMHFRLFRKTREGVWTAVGLELFGNWSLTEVSDSHGHFSLSNLRAGEYIVCTLLPAEAESSAPQVCMGNSFRIKDAATVKVQAGEAIHNADIVIPLTGFYTVSGTVTALDDGHPLARGAVRLLYADGRETARETPIQQTDGRFSFAYVPAGSYILQVEDAADAAQPASGAGDTQMRVRSYANKELPLVVQGDVEDVDVVLGSSQEPAKQ